MRSNPTKATRPGDPAGGRPEARPGFSLAEMLVVLVVVSVMAYLGVPRIEVVRFRMDGAAWGAMAALMSAQRLAVKEQHNVVILFDPDHRRLVIHQDRDNSGTMDAAEPVRTVAFDDGVAFGRGGAPSLGDQSGVITFTGLHDGLRTVRFVRNGSTSEDGIFYLTSTRASRGPGYVEDSRAIRIDRPTGRVTWFAYRGADTGWVEGT